MSTVLSDTRMHNNLSRHHLRPSPDPCRSRCSNDTAFGNLCAGGTVSKGSEGSSDFYNGASSGGKLWKTPTVIHLFAPFAFYVCHN